jgi:hypothetical protein
MEKGVDGFCMPRNSSNGIHYTPTYAVPHMRSTMYTMPYTHRTEPYVHTYHILCTYNIQTLCMYIQKLRKHHRKYLVVDSRTSREVTQHQSTAISAHEAAVVLNYLFFVWQFGCGLVWWGEG